MTTCCARPAMQRLDLSDGAVVPTFMPSEKVAWSVLCEPAHVVGPSRLREAYRCAACGATRGIA